MIEFINITKTNEYTLTKKLSETNWIHLEKPSHSGIKKLSEDYHFPLDYLTAILDNQEISRFEAPDDEQSAAVLFLMQYPKLVTSPSGFKQYEAVPFSIIVTPQMIITAANENLDLLNTLKTKTLLPLNLEPKENLPLQLAWYFSNLFNQYINTIKHDADGLEKDIQDSTENKQLFQLMDMQKSLIYFNAALEQNLTVFKKVHEAPWLMKSPTSQTILFDIIIENKQALASSNIQLDLLTQLGTMFSAIVGNNMNIVMKVLTVITISLTIPTLIGGIYGMNVALPFQNDGHAFWWIMLATLGLVSLTVWALKKFKFF